MNDLMNNTNGHYNLQGWTFEKIIAFIKSLDSNSRLIDLMSGGPEDILLGLGDVDDRHLYTDPGDVQPVPNRYGMIGEYSNVASYSQGHEWQPGRCKTMKHMNTSAEMADYFIKTLQEIEQVVGHVSASVYTQTTDIEDECDGWLSYDRLAKFDANQTAYIRAAQQRIQEAANHYSPGWGPKSEGPKPFFI